MVIITKCSVLIKSKGVKIVREPSGEEEGGVQKEDTSKKKEGFCLGIQCTYYLWVKETNKQTFTKIKKE